MPSSATNGLARIAWGELCTTKSSGEPSQPIHTTMRTVTMKCWFGCLTRCVDLPGKLRVESGGRR